MMLEATVLRKTISSQIADVIRSNILSGKYKAGDQLRQEPIASEMGVSRIPVREALHQLHSEGFVTLVSQKGAVVTGIALEEILELYEFRARVETWLIALAIPNMEEKDFATAANIACRFNSNDGQGGYSSELNWQFHLVLYAPSKREATIEIVSKLYKKVERYTNLMAGFAVNHEKSVVEHDQLLGHCRARDTPRAVDLLDTHILGGGRTLVDRLARFK